ncbi:MAG: 16S rRNA (cytidine(1402)-2'-O)-methyltransferase [Cyclobacteriaceae bacterium]
MSETQLYLVPTPIGNLKDITFRAIEILKSVDVILAEDTRTSGYLLNHYEVKTPMRSFHAHNEHKKVDSVVEELNSGVKMALISDAGSPGISDPGFLLVRTALNSEVVIESLPGPTALIPAIVKSGFPTDRFVYEGFLPHKKGRQTRIKQLENEERTIVFYESPHRLIKTLNQLKDHLGEERRVSVSRELTKKFEETITSTLSDLIGHFESVSPKGEFVIVVEGKTKK